MTKYEADKKAFDEHMDRIKPKLENYANEFPDQFEKDMREWHMAKSCDAPNKPGYYRANND